MKNATACCFVPDSPTFDSANAFVDPSRKIPQINKIKLKGISPLIFNLTSRFNLFSIKIPAVRLIYFKSTYLATANRRTIY